MDWPIYYKNILRVGNISSNVGVVTLWTERDAIAKLLDQRDYAAVGNLYAAAGINHMMRNIFANPMIRYLIMWGADMSQSGHALLKFMQNGIDEHYAIVGARGEIEQEIPKRAIELFRKHVALIDLRGKPMSAIAQKRIALSTNENNPNVMRLMGSVRMASTGRTTIVITDHTRATSSIVTHPPATEMPGMMLTVR